MRPVLRPGTRAVPIRESALTRQDRREHKTLPWPEPIGFGQGDLSDVPCPGREKGKGKGVTTRSGRGLPGSSRDYVRRARRKPSPPVGPVRSRRQSEAISTGPRVFRSFGSHFPCSEHQTVRENCRVLQCLVRRLLLLKAASARQRGLAVRLKGPLEGDIAIHQRVLGSLGGTMLTSRGVCRHHRLSRAPA
jgi:hypothetical protein